ncbi:MAG: potassium channel family protein [Thermoplasmatota archaeon]
MTQTAQELVLEMKDTSELMVDLAYSSVFYHSEGIAKEVLGLEENMGELLTELQRRVLEAVRADELTNDHAMVLLRVAQSAEIIANSALEIADVVLRDVELHPVLRAAIHESDSIITKVTLDPDSSMCNRSLRDLELETETGMRILAVKRAGRWYTGVEGDFVLHAEDLLIGSGPLEAEEEFLAVSHGEQRID